ncbi:MAG TPA: hypothetical protein VLA32_04230 [Anaerolineales bacterium]|jgi:molybdopterin converting factor small subunit|nr:hypothetical protein [Anaerolineales bacterium]
MRILFYANMRTLVGQSALEIEQLDEGNTLGNLIMDLIRRFPQIRPHLLDEAGELRPDVPVFIDGRNPRLRNMGMDARIPLDAEICFFSPISSGRLNVEVLRDPAKGPEESIDES